MKQNIILFTVFTIFCSLSQSAIASALSSKTNWTISTFGNEAGAEPFCAMAKGFEDNTVLTIAHNQRGESSLALESDALNLIKGQDTQIIIRSGRDYLSTLTAKPVSARALVLKLGADKRFIDALQVNGEIFVHAGESKVEMTTKDFEQAVNELQECTKRALKNQNKGDRPGFSEYEGQDKIEYKAPKKEDNAASVSDKKSRALVSAREERLGKAKQKTSETNEKNKQPTLKEVQVSEVRTKIGELDSLEKENSRLSKALLDMRKKYATATKSAVDFNLVKDLTEKAEILAKENRILKSKLEADESNRPFIDMTEALARMQVREKNLLEQIQEQNEEIESLSKELVIQKKRSEEQKKERVSQVKPEANESELTMLRGQNANLQKALNAFGSSNPDQSANELQLAYNNALNSLRSRVKTLEAENSSLKQSKKPVASGLMKAEEVRVVEAVASDKKPQRRSLISERTQEWKLAKLEKRYEQAEKENKRLGLLLAKERENKRRDVVVENLSGSDFSGSLQSSGNRNVRYNFVESAQTRTLASSSIMSLLQRANISTQPRFQKLDHVSRVGFSVYQWEENGSFGTLEVTRAAGAEVLDTLHNAYIEKARRRCQGSFEAIPTDFYSKRRNALAYDVACIDGPNSNAVASLYFLYDQGNFMTFALETTADRFEQAMSSRDRIAQSFL